MYLLYKIVHHANECRKKLITTKQNANYTNMPENKFKSLFIICHVAQESSNDIWFSDNGCSNHMTGNRDLFATLDNSVKSEVKLGNDNKVFVMGKGVINLF